MSISSELRSALDSGDPMEVTKIYDLTYPKMPKLADRHEAEVVMHKARTGCRVLKLEKRLYSHAWLMERGIKSDLPDDLRPPSQQVRPVIFSAVGVAVNSLSHRSDRVEEAKAIEKVMARAAGDMIRAGITDGKRISARMWEAREQFIRGEWRREI